MGAEALEKTAVSDFSTRPRERRRLTRLDATVDGVSVSEAGAFPDSRVRRPRIALGSVARAISGICVI